MAMTTTQAVAILFGAYGLSNDIDRQTIYGSVLKDIPPGLLESAVYKVLGEWDKTFLPPPAVIINAAKSLVEYKSPDKRIKPWEEALAEIEKKRLSTPWRGTPEWSTPQIEKTIKTFGWNNLLMSNIDDTPIIRAQLKKIYESICERDVEDARNGYILGKNRKGILGIQDNAKKGLQGVSSVVVSVVEGREHQIEQ